MSDLLDGIRLVAEAVDKSSSELNELDAHAGDGDLGVTMSTASRTVLGLLPDLAGKEPAEVLRTCGASIARYAPSTCGTLVATGFLRAARAADAGVGPDAAAVLLDAARGGIAERGKAEPGSKTMLDALAPAASAAVDAATRGLDVAAQLRAASAAAEAGARATALMVPRHGRAGWLAERSAGHEDGGARLVAIVLNAAAEATSARPEASSAPS